MASQSDTKTDRSQVRSALRALELLECFTPARPELSMTDLARKTGLPPSTTARLVSTLESSGYLRKTESGRYACAARLVSIALATLQGMSIYEVSLPHLTALRDATGETANLAVPGQDGRPIYSRQVESTRSIRHKVWLGETLPSEGTAMGDAMLGTLDEDGFAMRLGSIEPDVAAVAAPVRDGVGTIIGAFSITMPLYRANEDKMRRYGLLVVDHANQASTELGWQGGGANLHTLKTG